MKKDGKADNHMKKKIYQLRRKQHASYKYRRKSIESKGRITNNINEQKTKE